MLASPLVRFPCQGHAPTGKAGGGGNGGAGGDGGGVEGGGGDGGKYVQHPSQAEPQPSRSVTWLASAQEMASKEAQLNEPQELEHEDGGGVNGGNTGGGAAGRGGGGVQ